MTDLETRIIALERRILAAEFYNRKLAARIGAGNDTPAGGSATCYLCYLAQPIGAASAPPDSSSIPGGPAGPQTIYQISGGAYVPAGSAMIYNGLTTEAFAGFTSILVQNSDNSYTIVAQGCT